MSLHRSLKTKPAGLNQHRNVLKRSERVAKLLSEDKFDPEQDSPIGMPKVGNRAMVVKKKKKTQDADGDAADAGSDS